MNQEIEKVENEIQVLIQKLQKLQKETQPTPVPNYEFDTLAGKTTLLDLFGDKLVLFAIHNMGQGCRYCTLWADNINGLLPHLESAGAVVLLSKDSPEEQRRFANSRQWRYRMASHKNSDYSQTQSTSAGHSNSPGVVCYLRKDNQIFKKNSSTFGPGDLFCAQWHVLSLAGLDDETWTPQFNYWKRPDQLDDGGKNLV